MSSLAYTEHSGRVRHYLIVDILLLVQNGSHFVRVAVEARLNQRRLPNNNDIQRLLLLLLRQTETASEGELTTASRSVRPRPTSCFTAPTLWLKQDRTRVDASVNADTRPLITFDITGPQSSDSKQPSTNTDITRGTIQHGRAADAGVRESLACKGSA